MKKKKKPAKKKAKNVVKKKTAKKVVKKTKAAPVAKPMNAINWFEIPVTDYNRAATFYCIILGVRRLDFMEFGGVKMGMLPVKNGGVGGAIVHSHSHVPSDRGALVYLNGGKDLTAVLSRVESAGGRVVIPKTLITKDIGYMAVFMDSEGNKVALHSSK